MPEFLENKMWKGSDLLTIEEQKLLDEYKRLHPEQDFFDEYAFQVGQHMALEIDRIAKECFPNASLPGS